MDGAEYATYEDGGASGERPELVPEHTWVEDDRFKVSGVSHCSFTHREHETSVGSAWFVGEEVEIGTGEEVGTQGHFANVMLLTGSSTPGRRITFKRAKRPIWMRCLRITSRRTRPTRRNSRGNGKLGLGVNRSGRSWAILVSLFFEVS